MLSFWVCGVLTKKLYDFLSLPWQLHKEYCHTIKTLGKTSKKSKFLCRNHFELHRWKKWNGCFYVCKIQQSRLLIPHLLLPMFFNLMSKNTHFVFRQNRSRKHIAFVQLGLPTGLDFLVPRDSHGTEEKKDFFWHFFANQIVLLSRDVPGRDGTACLKSRPVPSRGKILSLSRCPFVPGQWRNFCPVVPKSCTVPSRWKP